jgi:hypothetical protein
MKTIIETYNNSSHISLNKKFPNQVFNDNYDQMTRHLMTASTINEYTNQFPLIQAKSPNIRAKGEVRQRKRKIQ